MSSHRIFCSARSRDEAAPRAQGEVSCRRGLARRCWLYAMLLACAVSTHAAGEPPAAAPRAQLQRAAELARAERFADAVALLEALIRRYPSDPAPYNELAVLHASRGDLDRARTLLVSALETAPRYALVHRNLQQVFGALAGDAYDRALLGKAGARSPPVLASLADGGGTLATKPPKSASAQTRTDAGPSTTAPATPPGTSASTGVAPRASADRASRALALTPATTRPPADSERDVAATVRAWATAWAEKNVERYLHFYGDRFIPSRGMSRSKWTEQRRQRLTRPRFIEISVDSLVVAFPAPDRATARFSQTYRSDRLKSKVEKVLQLSRSDGHWKIVRETIAR
jgi:hypothetical protein